VSVRMERFPDALGAFLAARAHLFDASTLDIPPVYEAMRHAVYGWEFGWPGMRAKSSAARSQVERLANDCYRLIEQYTDAFLALGVAASAAGIGMSVVEAPTWIMCGLEAKDGESNWGRARTFAEIMASSAAVSAQHDHSRARAVRSA